MGDEILYPLKGSLSPIFTSLTCSGPSNGSREGSHDGSSLCWPINPMTDPWEWYIYLHLVCFLKVNVGKETIHASYRNILFSKKMDFCQNMHFFDVTCCPPFEKN